MVYWFNGPFYGEGGHRQQELVLVVGEIEKTVAKALGIPLDSKDKAKLTGKKWVATNLGDVIEQKDTKQLVIS